MRAACGSLVAVLLIVMIASQNAVPAFAQSDYSFRTVFNSDRYGLNMVGFVTVYLQFHGRVAELGSAGVYLIFVRSDGSILRQFFGRSYVGSPIDLPTDVEVPLEFIFTIPIDLNLISGSFYYVTVIAHREISGGAFTNDTSIPNVASTGNRTCVLDNPLNPPYGNLSAILDGFEADYLSLKRNYTSLSQNFTSMMDRYDALNRTYGDLTSSYASLQQDYDALQKSYSSIQQSYDAISSNVGALQAQLSTLQQILAAVVVALVATLTGTMLYFVRKIAKIQKLRRVNE